MSDPSASSHLQVLFEAVLQDYEKQTGIALAKHPLADKLHNCDTVESVTAVLHEQTQAFSEFWGEDKVLIPLKNTISVMCKLSATANFGRDIGLHFPPVTAIHTGLAVLLSAVKGTIDSYDSLVDLLESIDHFLNRLDIYTKFSPTIAMTEILVKILVELLSTLALATKQIKEGKRKNIFKKLLGDKAVDAVLQRLDRLTQDEARITAAQTLEIVHGLFQIMKEIIDDGEASVDHLRDILKIMQELVSNKNKSERDGLQQKIIEWLSSPDPWKNHDIARESRYPGSAAWFIQGNIFSEWKGSKGPSSLLWVHGKPGAGKSVFCSTIIEDVDDMRKAGLASLAFFYCDFREEEKTGLRGLLSSLLVQLCPQADSYYDVLFRFYSDHSNGSRHPSDNALMECLKDLLKLSKLAPVYLIVDALDECPRIPAVRSPRSRVLNLIAELINSQFPNLRICATSRPETDIKHVLDPLNPRYVSLHDEREQKRDIEDYIKSVINTHPENGGWKDEHKQLVIDVLSEKANGMFRWVECQVDYICGCIPANIQQALADLPKTLDGTYQRTLREIKEAHWEFAHRVFQFVSVASRPLRVKELSELLAFDFKAGPIPKFHEDWRLPDPVNALLSTCSSFLAIVYVGYRSRTKAIQFSHFSVKEYLMSARLAEATDTISRRYHISITPAHTLAAQACLGILLHLDKDVTSYSWEKWPLAEYAAEHWAYHSQFEDVSQNVEDGMKQLFDPSKPHLTVCVRIHNPDPIPLERRPGRDGRSLPPLGTPLHYAALWGFHSIIEFLIAERSQDVHSRRFPDNATPLHLASKRGHTNAARMLIKHGAGVMVQNDNGETPLHLASQEGQVEAAHLLIELAADVTSRNNDEETPLHLALSGSSDLGLSHRQLEVAHMLIERGADVTSQNRNGATPLHRTSRVGEVGVTRMLIELGADVTAQDKDGETPLHLALSGPSRNYNMWLSCGHVDVARILIECGADVTTRNGDGETPLHRASRVGEVKVVRMLIELGADVTAQDKYGRTPLHLAFSGASLTMMSRGQADVARMLIAHGADVSAKDKYGVAPLHLALSGSDDLGLSHEQVDVACLLIERGADVISQNGDGETPLHMALHWRWAQVEVACMLIERGADVTAQDKDGETPLHMAAQFPRVARMLTERGADVTARDKRGNTPLHLAAQYPRVARMPTERGADVTAGDKKGNTPLHRTSQAEVARMLIELGTDVSSKNRDGETPLHLALSANQVQVAHILIDHGADVTVQDKDGETPFHRAVLHGEVEVARTLLEHGADVTARDKDGETLLHRALKYGQVEVARTLLEHGADVTARDKDGETLLHLALQYGEVEVARTLLEHGADVTARDNWGKTPLFRTLQRGQVEAARMLIEHGANVTAEEDLLHQALQAGQVEVAHMLIELGANVTAQGEDGETPLHLALSRGQVEVARMLAERGKDATAQDEDRETPLHPVLQEGQVEVASRHIGHGTDVRAENNDGEIPLHPVLQEGQVDVTCQWKPSWNCVCT